jgi:hypothetical protein
MQQPRERELNLNVRITAEERAKLHALADDRDLSASTLVRHMLREAYAARFGTAAPTGTKEAPKAKRAGRAA